MNEAIKQRARAIIFMGDSIVSMYREFNDRCFYTFPGGGQEGAETMEECVVREVTEEFGITVEPIKEVYVYKNEISEEHFYICKYICGTLFTGKGEEFQADRNRGVYKPTTIKLSDIPNLPLMPPEVAESLFKDYTKYGTQLRSRVKTIKAKLK